MEYYAENLTDDGLLDLYNFVVQGYDDPDYLYECKQILEEEIEKRHLQE